MIAWGHPSGLELGKNKDAYTDLLNKLTWAQELKADHFRIVIDSPKLWNSESSKETITIVMQILNNIADIANKEKLNTNITLGSSDLALLLDAPLGDKSGLVISWRRSYL